MPWSYTKLEYTDVVSAVYKTFSIKLPQAKMFDVIDKEPCFLQGRKVFVLYFLMIK